METGRELEKRVWEKIGNKEKMQGLENIKILKWK